MRPKGELGERASPGFILHRVLCTMAVKPSFRMTFLEISKKMLWLPGRKNREVAGAGSH